MRRTVRWWQDKPKTSRNWARGAEGERIVGELLNRLAEAGSISAIHDVGIPGSSANIDHVAVAPLGIHIIDAKMYRTQKVEVRNNGGMFNRDERLYIASRDLTPLVHKLRKQILIINEATRDLQLPTVITPVLCFVRAEWGFLSRGYTLEGVKIVWPKKLEEILRRPGPLSEAQIQAVGNRLRERLHPA